MILSVTVLQHVVQDEDVRILLSRFAAALAVGGRVAACEVLINTAAVRDQIRDSESSLNIPDLIKEGSVQYGMQSFDQSLMQWYSQKVISYESAMFYASSPAEFALRTQGIIFIKIQAAGSLTAKRWFLTLCLGFGA